MPILSVDEFSGLDELYRKTLAALRPSMSTSQLVANIHGFDIASINEKARLIAQLLNSTLSVNEATYLVDRGGALTDAGGLVPEINLVVSHLDYRPHPPVILIAPRMVPRKLRRQEDDISYLSVRSLTRDASERLIQKLLRDLGCVVTDEEIEQLVRLSDGHPFNFYRMIDEIKDKGIQLFLASPTLFNDWKHRQSSEYLQKMSLNGHQVRVLALLLILPELDFASILGALEEDQEALSEALTQLLDLHILEANSDRFALSPALRIAVERDKRIRLTAGVRKSAIAYLARSLTVKIEEGTAPISLIDAAILASLEAGQVLSPFAAVFLLPSHHVWIAKRHYDQRQWADSIRAAQEALRGGQRMSLGGRVAAYRYLCLSASRIGEEQIFDDGVADLQRISDGDWAESNIAFLKGFNLRLKGNLPKAEEQFRKAYNLSPGNISAAREIAAICLTRGSLDQAERFAREAQSHARTNPYVLDILIGVMIRKHGKAAQRMSEIKDLFDALEKTDEESNKSFFVTRKAELEHLWGDNRRAMELIETAVKKTPRIFEPRRLYAAILLKDGNKTRALEQIEVMKDIVNARDPGERRSNYRLYLEMYSLYLEEVGNYAEAKNVYSDLSVFDEAEQRAASRRIELVQGFRSV